MVNFLPWPRTITDMRGKASSAYELAARLTEVAKKYDAGASDVTAAQMLVSDHNSGRSMSTISENLHNFASATHKFAQNCTSAATAAQHYGKSLEELTAKHEQLKILRDKLIKNLLVLYPVDEPEEFAEYYGKFERAELDYAFALSSAEDEFIDALGLEKFPDPNTGNYKDVITVAELDHKNRQLLEEDYQRLQSKYLERSKHRQKLSPAEMSQLRNIEAIREQISRIESSVDPVTHKHVIAQLYQYDPAAFDNSGKALIGVGDLDHAKDIAFLIPGLGTSAANIADPSQYVHNIYDKVRTDNPEASFAGVICMGYNAPHGKGQYAHFVDTDHAREGGLEIAHQIDQFAMLRKYQGTGQGDTPAEDKLHLSLIGHSYGATTAAYAASNSRLSHQLDDLILVGAPGAGPISHASDFGLATGHVHVAKDSHDTLSDIGRILPSAQKHDNGYVVALGLIGDAAGLNAGQSPYTTDFGAHEFDGSDNPVDHDVSPGKSHVIDKIARHIPYLNRLDHAYFRTLNAHNGYFNPGTTSLDNISHIVAPHETTAEHTKPVIGRMDISAHEHDS